VPISRPTIEAVREQTDIAQVIGHRVRLKRAGRNLVGLCPFHNEKSPSFNVSRERQTYHCFGCNEGGDVFAFLMTMDGLSFVEAITECAQVAGVTIEEEQLTQEEVQQRARKASLFDVCKASAEFFHTRLLTDPAAQEARDTLAQRGITDETIRYGQLGYAPDSYTALLEHLHSQGISHDLACRASVARRSERTGRPYDVMRDRLVIPIFDRRSRPIAFGGRLLSGEGPKYLNSPESEIYNKSATLYGLNWARGPMQRKDRVLVVEGYFDVLSLHQAGFPETVATCGTALTPLQVKELRQNTDTVVALFDMDEAGMEAADRSLQIFLDQGVEARHLELPEGKDPDDFVRAQGPDALEACLASSVPLIELSMRRAVKRHGTTPAGRQKAVRDIAPMLRKLPGVLRSDILVRAANLLGVREDALREAIGTPSTAPQAPGPAGRWTGNKALNNLLWLLLNAPDAASPLVSDANLDLLSDRDDVKHAILLILDGFSLTQVLDQVTDPDLGAVLRLAGAREGLFQEEEAEPATRSILATLELTGIDTELREINLQMSSDDVQRNAQALGPLLARRQALQIARQVAVKRKVGGADHTARASGSPS
jgi:DNA primase